MTPPREAIRGWSGTKTHYPFDSRRPAKSTVRGGRRDPDAAGPADAPTVQGTKFPGPHLVPASGIVPRVGRAQTCTNQGPAMLPKAARYPRLPSGYAMNWTT